MIERVGLLDIAAGLADHDTQLDFPIGLGAAARDHDVVIGADEARNGLGEEDRFGWGLESGLARMIGIIEADREEFADAVHRHAVARASLDQRSEEHTSELQSLMRISYAGFCWKKQTTNT